MQDSALAMASGHSLLASATLLPAALALRHIIVLYASACLLHRGLQFSEPPRDGEAEGELVLPLRLRADEAIALAPLAVAAMAREEIAHIGRNVQAVVLQEGA